MKRSGIIFILLCASSIAIGQSIRSGQYEFGLRLALDPKSKLLSGYYENYTGWDEELEIPRFSCVFYIEGFVEDQEFNVLTYYPDDKASDTITGIIQVLNDSLITLKLRDDHGGCWNVQNFGGDPVRFGLEHQTEWIGIKYVVAEKSFFYSTPSDLQIQKSYIVKNDFVCIDKLEGGWAHCTYFGNTTTTGWIKACDLN